ncbi:MAG TPA: YeeE/YedE family protein [Rhodospirillales bacterium]|nr:YeeE/YedE family protein [Rhodospirillales bacterium]
MLNVFSLTSGLLFGFGLAVSSMINPAKIVGFLDITGNWDPSLAFVMGGAVFVTALTFRLILKRPKPIFTDIFELPSKVSLDGKLITGAAIFGIGWAMSGLCPGPAISSIGFLDEKLLIFVCTLLIGSFIGKKWR